MPDLRKVAKPPWASKIQELRRKLGKTQEEFARELGVTQGAVSRWERGEREPLTEQYVGLGRLTQGTERWYFWNRAGLSREDYRAELEEMTKQTPRPEVHIEVQPARGALHSAGSGLKKKPDVIAIPLLKDSAAAGSPRMIEEAQIEDTIFGMRQQCPHPDDMVAIRISGDSMSPILEDGYIVVVDTATHNAREMVGDMVAARDPEGAVTIKWLREVEGELMLVAQHTSLRFQPMFLRPGWGIVGKVVWWIGHPA